MELILNLLQKEVLSIEDASIIENAIDSGYVDTCDLFDDFVTYVSKNADVDYDTLMDFQEQYENLKSHKENLKNLLD